MKYILFNDVNLIINKYRKVLIFNILILFIYLCVNISIDNQTNINLFLSMLGINCTLDSNLLSIIMYIFNIIFIIFIPLVLIINDLEHMDNIFLRLKIKKWITFKIMSILLITFTYKILIYIIIMILGKNSSIMYYFIKDYLFSISIQMLFMFIYLVANKNRIIIPFIIILFAFNIKYAILNIININIYILFILPIIELVLLVLISKKKYIL